MEDLKEPLLEMFTDDPVNWVKWAVVFTVLIGFFILSFKIYGKIEYKLSIQKKADGARAKGHIGVLYLALIFMPFVLAGFTAMALDIPFATGSDDKGSAEVMDTGAWNEGTMYHDGYTITFSCPEVGHPDPESEWRTWYEDPGEELDLDIKINYADAIPPQDEYIQEETQLWGHTVIYEERKTQNRVWPDREQSLFVGYLEMGPDHYLQIEIMGVGEVNTPSYMFLENEDFQNSFRLEITKIL